MINYIILFFISSFIYSLSHNEKALFFSSFESEIDNALKFIDNNQNIMDRIFFDYDVDVDLAVSIMFPELVRYNNLQDKIEISINKLLYINGGLEYSDLSIGLLQMKPSFIQRLSNTKILNKYDELFHYSDTLSNQEIRTIIIERLQSIEYQLKYLAYFIKVIDTYNKYVFIDYHDKIKYYSTAYNSGSWYNQENNNNLSQKKTYPYGPNNDEIKQYSYSDISLYYYQNFLNK